MFSLALLIIIIRNCVQLELVWHWPILFNGSLTPGGVAWRHGDIFSTSICISAACIIGNCLPHAMWNCNAARFVAMGVDECGIILVFWGGRGRGGGRWTSSCSLEGHNNDGFRSKCARVRCRFVSISISVSRAKKPMANSAFSEKHFPAKKKYYVRYAPNLTKFCKGH